MAAKVEQPPITSEARFTTQGSFIGRSTFRRAIRLAFEESSSDYSVKFIKRAFEMNDKVTVGEMICSLYPSGVIELKQRYLAVHGLPLEGDIEHFTQGTFRMLLLGFVAKSVEQSSPDAEMFDVIEIEQLRTSLYGMVDVTRKLNLLDKVTTKSPEFLNAAMNYPLPMDLFMNYDHCQLGEVKRAIVTIMECSANRPNYFAKVVYKAMMDPNHIDYTAIVRVVTTRAKTDMNDIKKEYMESFGRSLFEDVYNAFSEFECRDDLVALLNLNAAN